MLQCIHMQLPVRFSNGPFAMDPLGLEAMQAGTLAWRRKRAHDEATAAVPLDATIVGLEPCTHGLTDVPRGLVPHQHQRRVPCRRQPVRAAGRATGSSRH